MVALGGRVEVRASWHAYLDEFAHAFSVAHQTETVRNLQQPGRDTLITQTIHQLVDISPHADVLHRKPMSNFEAKYVNIDQKIYRLCLDTREESARANCKLRAL